MPLRFGILSSIFAIIIYSQGTFAQQQATKLNRRGPPVSAPAQTNTQSSVSKSSSGLFQTMDLPKTKMVKDNGRPTTFVAGGHSTKSGRAPASAFVAPSKQPRASSSSKLSNSFTPKVTAPVNTPASTNSIIGVSFSSGSSPGTRQ